MDILLLNGSPHQWGCTYTALSHLASCLTRRGMGVRMGWIGNHAIGCMGCGACKQTGECVVKDALPQILEMAKGCGGYVLGTPVHYGAAAGSFTGFLDRFFYSGKATHLGKAGAAIAVCRRAGGVTAIEQLERYFPLFSMPRISGGYWNVLYGTSPEEILLDSEGLSHLEELAEGFRCFFEKSEQKC